MTDILFHNERLEQLCTPGPYSRAQVDALAHELDAHGTLNLQPLETGLYVASAAGAAAHSGYSNVWVRDNVYVALAQLESGRPDLAARAAGGLLQFYGRHRQRFEAIVAGEVDPGDAMQRPHVRFDGTTLDELPERWPHAQNDALGYCLWLCASLARRQHLRLDRDAIDTLALLVRYLAAIRFWQDEDSGHWEETRKISASSIGVVVAALLEWRMFVGGADILTADLIDRGRTTLDAILPAECVQPSPRQNRRCDAALIFLLHPLGLVNGPIGDLVLDDVRRMLTGHIGIRRYPGDSYWAPDYDSRVSTMDQTRDFSDDVAARDALLERSGDEAQWCIFDPMLSALHGRRYLAGGTVADRDAQVWHFNRALAQVTTDWRCPELYFLRGGAWVPNPHAPLLWTQANLRLALGALRATAERAS